ncbi:caspase family protein [Stieleria varia]|uniref:caspase family protein n=1 Tax=Stieleria varia TaxID=2528005 RepID=UPI00313AA4DE
MLFSTHALAEDWVDPNYKAAPNKTPQLVIDAQGFSGRINRLAISDDGRWLAGVADKTVRVWNLSTQRIHATLRGYQEPDGFHIGYIDSITFSPDNQHLIVGVSDNSEFGSTRIYDLRQPGEIKQLVAGHTGCTRGVTFTKSGNRMATWGCDGFIVFYRQDNRGDWAIDFKVPWSGAPVALPENFPMPNDLFQFTEDERYLAFKFGSPLVVSVAQQRVVSDINQVPDAIKEIGVFNDNVNAPFSEWWFPDFKPALSSTKQPNEIFAVGYGNGIDQGRTVYFAASWKRDWAAHVVHNHSYEVTTFAWNKQANLAASADKLGRIHVWDPETGKSVTKTIDSVTQTLWNVRWAPDGRNLLFSDKNYPEGRWHFNRWAGTDKKLSLESYQVSATTAKMADHPVKPMTYHPMLGNIELQVVKNTENASIRPGRWDLRIAFPGKSRPAQSLIPWGDPAREAAINNYRIRVPRTKFGMVRCMRFVEYPGCESGATVIFGTDTGLLYEATIEQLRNGQIELHVRKQFLGHTADVTSFDVSPNQKTLATCSLDGTIRVYPLKPARAVGDIDFLNDGTRVVEVPRNGPSGRAGVLPEDTMLKFDNGSFYERIRKQQEGKYRPNQSVPIVVNRGVMMNERRQVALNVTLSEAPQLVLPLTSILMEKSGEWVSWTPEGYYDSSSAGAKFVGWHINRERHETAKFFPLDQFQPQYYQPKVVRYAITEQSSTIAIEKADAELDGFSALTPLTLASDSEVEQRTPPQIDILSPSPNYFSPTEKIRVVTRIRVPKSASLDSVRFEVDGHGVPGRPRLTNEQYAGREKEYWYEQSLALAKGDRKIAVRAFCNNQTQAESTIDCKIGAENAVDPSQGTLYILAVGMTKYANPDFELDYGAKDASDFVQAWTDLPHRHPGQIKSKILSDAEATCQNIRENGLQWLSNQPITANDTVMVFLSGHAVYDQNEDWYFAGHDVDPERLIATGISDAELDNVLRKIPTNLILFCDTCHAGGFEATAKVFKNPESGTSIWRGRGHVVFASCLPHEESLEDSRWENGAFTQAILEFLQSSKSDYDQDGTLTFDEMAIFVKSAVRRMTDESQNPAIEVPSSVSNIPFTTRH